MVPVVLDLQFQLQRFGSIGKPEPGIEVGAVVPRLVFDADGPVFQPAERDQPPSFAARRQAPNRPERAERQRSPLPERLIFKLQLEIQIIHAPCPLLFAGEFDLEREPHFAERRNRDLPLRLLSRQFQRRGDRQRYRLRHTGEVV